jgi:anion-transporting  ArsA/GET3 family ATPase
MFTGKGGVGKTTCAAATALYHASRGGTTLAISTDARRRGGSSPGTYRIHASITCFFLTTFQSINIYPLCFTE